MFTSRAEHRLLFNHGSAELRLSDHAVQHGLISQERHQRIVAKRGQIAHWTQRLERERDGSSTWAESIRRDAAASERFLEFCRESKGIRDEVLYRVRYQGYIAREERQIEKFGEIDRIRIPELFNYLQTRGLRKESALKLADARPMTLGQASRISGVNPADISVLMVNIAAGRRGGS